MAQKPTNVYTIYEKARKGEYYNKEYDYESGSGFFKGLDFYKKQDLINPTLHYVDERDLQLGIDSFLKNDNLISELARKSAASIGSRFDEDFLKEYRKRYHETYGKIAKHMFADTHKLYYHKLDNIDFEERTDKNYGKFRFFEYANNPVGKIMTEHSMLKSMIFTRHTFKSFLYMMTEMQYQDPQTSKEMSKAMSKDGGGGKNDIDKMFDRMKNDPNFKKMLDQELKEATEICKSLDEMSTSEEQDAMFSDSSFQNDPGKLSRKVIDEIAKELKRYKMNMGGVKNRIQNLLDRSADCFSAKERVIYDDIFNTNDLSGIEDYTFLHPKLRKILIEDVHVKDIKKHGKIDLYIDISGSMSGSSGVTGMTRIDFCKSFAFQMMEDRMLNKFYVFDGSVKERTPTPITLTTITSGGGTSITRVIENIEKEKRNAIILTDAEDSLSKYSEYAFFIGLSGCRFSSFNNDVLKKLHQHNQMIIFNGKSIKEVNSEGHVI